MINDLQISNPRNSCQSQTRPVSRWAPFHLKATGWTPPATIDAACTSHLQMCDLSAKDKNGNRNYFEQVRISFPNMPVNKTGRNLIQVRKYSWRFLGNLKDIAFARMSVKDGHVRSTMAFAWVEPGLHWMPSNMFVAHHPGECLHLLVLACLCLNALMSILHHFAHPMACPRDHHITLCHLLSDLFSLLFILCIGMCLVAVPWRPRWKETWGHQGAEIHRVESNEAPEQMTSPLVQVKHGKHQPTTLSILVEHGRNNMISWASKLVCLLVWQLDMHRTNQPAQTRAPPGLEGGRHHTGLQQVV